MGVTRVPIEIYKGKHCWFWSCRAPNGLITGDSAEGYTTRAKALQGLEATAREMVKWHAAQQKKKAPTKTTLGHQKPAGKRSTSLNSPTRRTGKPGG